MLAVYYNDNLLALWSAHRGPYTYHHVHRRGCVMLRAGLLRWIHWGLCSPVHSYSRFRTPNLMERNKTNMEEEIIPVGGKTWNFHVFKGINFMPSFVLPVADHMKNIQEMKCRDDDVFILTYPKCGTHWIREIVHMVKNRRAEYCPADEPDAPIGKLEIETIEKFRSPRTLYSHLPFRFLPEVYKQRRGKVITLLRGFRDVCTSFYHFMLRVAWHAEWDEFLTLMMNGKVPIGSWFDWMEELEGVVRDDPEYPLLVLKYEELQKDLKGGVRRIAEFLEIKLDETTLNEITEACSFETARKAKTEAALPENIKELSLDGKDPFLRKGVSGDWKNTFTVARHEAVRDLFRRRCTSGSILGYGEED